MAEMAPLTSSNVEGDLRATKKPRSLTTILNSMIHYSYTNKCQTQTLHTFMRQWERKITKMIFKKHNKEINDRFANGSLSPRYWGLFSKPREMLPCWPASNIVDATKVRCQDSSWKEKTKPVWTSMGQVWNMVCTSVKSISCLRRVTLTLNASHCSWNTKQLDSKHPSAHAPAKQCYT